MTTQALSIIVCSSVSLPLLQTGTQDGMCIIYEYCAGGDLTTFLEELQAKERTLSVELCHAFALRLLVAVDYVHRVCQRLHLDIKPDNILLSEARDQLYVADLGISQVKEACSYMI